MLIMRLSRDCRETVARLSRDCRETVARLSRDCRETVARLSRDCRETIARLSRDCRETVARLSRDCRETVARLSRDCRNIVHRSKLTSVERSTFLDIIEPNSTVRIVTSLAIHLFEMVDSLSDGATYTNIIFANVFPKGPHGAIPRNGWPFTSFSTYCMIRMIRM